MNNIAAIVLMPFYGVRFPPQGLAIVSSILEKYGFHVKVFDLNIDLYNYSKSSEMKQLWNRASTFKALNALSESSTIDKTLQLTSNEISDLKPALIAFSLFDTNIFYSCRLISMLKANGIVVPIIGGGPAITRRWPSVYPLFSYFDTLLPGRAEIKLPEYLSDSTFNFPRFASRFPHSTNWYQPKKFIPDYDGFPLTSYTDKGTLPALAGFGCTMKCRFCGERLLYKGYVGRALTEIVQEITELRDRYNVSHFYFHDSLLNPYPGSLEALADALTPLGITWEGQVRASSEFTNSLCYKLKGSGCVKLSFGSESGSDRVLKLMRKGISSKISHSTARVLHHNNIDFTTYYISGYPGEGIMDTLRSALHVYSLSKLARYGDLLFYPCGLSIGHPVLPISMKATKKPSAAQLNQGISKFHADNTDWSAGIHSPLERKLKSWLLSSVHALTTTGSILSTAIKAQKHLEKGRKYRQDGHHKNALISFSKATQTAKRWGLPWSEIGWTLESLSSNTSSIIRKDALRHKAIIAYSKALSLDQRDKVARKNLMKLKA